MSRTDYGQVEISLGEASYTLKPTLSAMQKIDRNFGSLREASRQVLNLSFDATVFVIAVGAGIGSKEAKDIAPAVFHKGVAKVVGPVSEYLAMLMNPTGDEPSEGDEDGAPGKD